MNQEIRIGIAEDHQLVRDGFVSILNSCNEIKVLFEVGNGKELLRALKEHRVDIILLDIAMPLVDGIEAMKEIKNRHPEIKVLVISAHSEVKSIFEYVRMGAVSFLPKNCSKATLVEAICEVHKTGTYFDPATLKLLERRGIIKERKLTESELLVLKYLYERKSYQEIAETLKINVRTVQWYKHILLAKTHTVDILQLLQYAKEHNLV